MLLVMSLFGSPISTLLTLNCSTLPFLYDYSSMNWILVCLKNLWFYNYVKWSFMFNLHGITLLSVLDHIWKVLFKFIYFRSGKWY
jgi:hypothetical protein